MRAKRAVIRRTHGRAHGEIFAMPPRDSGDSVRDSCIRTGRGSPVDVDGWGGGEVEIGNSRRILSPQMRENGVARIFQPRNGNVAKLPIRRSETAGKFVNCPPKTPAIVGEEGGGGEGRDAHAKERKSPARGREVEETTREKRSCARCISSRRDHLILPCLATNSARETAISRSRAD